MNKILKTPEHITNSFRIRVLPWQSIDPNIKLSKRKMDSASSKYSLEAMMQWPCDAYLEANNLYRSNSNIENIIFDIKALEIILNKEIIGHNEYEVGISKNLRRKIYHPIKADWHLTQETIKALDDLGYSCG